MKIKAIDFLSDSILPIDLNLDSHINTVRLNNFPFDQIPVISDSSFLGLVDKNFNLENLQIEKITEHLISLDKQNLVLYNDNIFNIVNQIVNQGSKFLVVISEDDEYIGIIESESVFKKIGSLPTFSNSGTILVIDVISWNYSFHQITGIIEAENTKILGILIDEVINDENKIKIILKIESKNIDRIVAAFERYGYEITSYYEAEKISNKKLREHFDALMHYLNV